MNLEEVRKHRYWTDEHDHIWERISFCEHPTASFVKMINPRYHPTEPQVLGGAIGCLNLQKLKPIKELVED